MIHKITIVLEKSEIDILKSGKMVELKIGGQPVELFFQVSKYRKEREPGELNGVQRTLAAVEEFPGQSPQNLVNKAQLGSAAVYSNLNLLKRRKKIFRGKNGGWFIMNGHTEKELMKNGH